MQELLFWLVTRERGIPISKLLYKVQVGNLEGAHVKFDLNNQSIKVFFAINGSGRRKFF